MFTGTRSLFAVIACLDTVAIMPALSGASCFGDKPVSFFDCLSDAYSKQNDAADDPSGMPLIRRGVLTLRIEPMAETKYPGLRRNTL